MKSGASPNRARLDSIARAKKADVNLVPLLHAVQEVRRFFAYIMFHWAVLDELHRAVTSMNYTHADLHKPSLFRTVLVWFGFSLSRVANHCAGSQRDRCLSAAQMK